MNNSQAGAVAVLHRNFAGQIYWTTSVPLPELPLGAYVPVEALEGLVAKWLAYARVPGHSSELRCTQNGARLCADDLTQLIERSKELIKERSNG